MKFDSNRAWQKATAAIRANREVLFALSGVFFLLPTLAFSLLFPQPSPPPGADQATMMNFAADYYSRTLPFAIPVAVLQAGGTLGLLTLLTDRARPTVGEAIRIGFASLLPYLGAQILLGAGAGFAALLVIGLAGLIGSSVVSAAAIAAVVVGLIWLAVRFSLSAPVVAVDGVRNPVTALTRSWKLTKGNGAKIFVFYALIILVFAVVLSIVLMITGVVLALLLPAKLATVVSAVISASMGAGMALTLVAALAAVHAQLSGESPEQIGMTFD